MPNLTHSITDDPVLVQNPNGVSPVVVVCEHASSVIPAEFDELGLAASVRHSHAAWDPGAFSVARGMAQRLDATLVASTVSRLVYDCNRPPDAPDAMPAQSERVAVPGNVGLTATHRADRTKRFYEPFRAALAQVIASKPAPVIVTIHSFTPIFHGKQRNVEIGVLHDADTRLADVMLALAPNHTSADVLRNMPYGPEHGVTHTLQEHGLRHGHLNVMLEVRNDLISTEAEQDSIAETFAAWVEDARAVQAKDAPCPV